MRAVLTLILVACASAASAQVTGNNGVMLIPFIAGPANIASNSDEVRISNAAGMATVGIQVTGTFSGTLTPMCSLDSANFQAILVTPTNDTTAVSSITATGLWTGSVAACRTVLIDASGWVSGTAVVTVAAIQSGGASSAGGGGITSVGTQAEDTAHVDGDELFMGGCVRRDTPTSLSGTENDNTVITCDDVGRTRTRTMLVDSNDAAIELASESVTPSIYLDVDETEDEIDDGAGCLAGLYVGNRDTTPVFVKVFTVDADSVTIGSTAPNMIFQVASSGADGVGQNLLPQGVCIPYTTGLSIAATVDEATSDTTGPGANEVVVTAFVKN